MKNNIFELNLKLRKRHNTLALPEDHQLHHEYKNIKYKCIRLIPLGVFLDLSFIFILRQKDENSNVGKRVAKLLRPC